MDKRGKWNIGDAFNLDDASAMIDDNLARNMANDIRKQLGANALQPHKSVVSGPGVNRSGIPISSSRRSQHNVNMAQPGYALNKNTKDLGGAAMQHRSPAGRSGGKDSDLMSSMVGRL